jgi:hypothetical protein
MYGRDRAFAVALLVVLAGTLGLGYLATTRFVSDAAVRLALACAALALLAFNVASIRAMLRYNREDWTFIYTLDIKHRNEHRASRAAQFTMPWPRGY